MEGISRCKTPEPPHANPLLLAAHPWPRHDVENNIYLSRATSGNAEEDLAENGRRELAGEEQGRGAMETRV